MRIADIKLGLNSQALVVLHALSDLEVDFKSMGLDEDLVTLDTYVLYNGRERGILIAFTPRGIGDNTLFIFVAEHRSSDSILVLDWVDRMSINPPTVDDIPETAWNGKQLFPWLRVDKVVSEVALLIKGHVREFVQKQNKGASASANASK